MTKKKQMKKILAGLTLATVGTFALSATETASANDWSNYGQPMHQAPQAPQFYQPAPMWNYGEVSTDWNYGYEVSSVDEVPSSTTEVVTSTADITSSSSSAIAAAAANSQASNLYPVGQCTWGVKELAPWVSNYWGNAGDWAANAAADGFTVGTTPVVGAIAVWMDGGYGHVALVTEVVSETNIQVLESNVNGNMTIANHRGSFDPTTAQGTVVYIYPAS